MDINALPPNQYKTAVYLLAAANKDDFVVGDRQHLSKALGITPSQVTRIMRALLEVGFIERVNRGQYRIQPEGNAPRSINAPSRSVNAPPRSIPDTKFAIPVMTNTTNMISRTTSDEDLLTSNEVNKSLRAKKIPKGKNSVPTYSDNDDELTVVGEFRDEVAQKRSTTRGGDRKQRRMWADFSGKPRSEWTTFDAANYFSASIESRKPTMWGVVSTKHLIGALNKWNKRWSGNVAEVVVAMDKYLNDPRAMSRLDRDPQPIKHFLDSLKRQGRKSTAVGAYPEELMEIARKFMED